MSYFLGIDCGTSGCRASLVDAEAQPVVHLHTDLPPPLRAGAGVSQDADAWWTALSSLLDDLAVRQELEQVDAICIDGTSSTLLLCDASGEPTGPALMYNDSRAASQADLIRRHAPPGNLACSAGSSLAKLLWLLEQPAGSRATHAVHQADWLSGKLSGRFDISDANNALKLGYDAVTRRWPDWLHQLPVASGLLPQVVAAGTTIGIINASACTRWGIRPGTRIVSGTTDSTAGIIATGAGPGEAVTTLGSTLVIKVLGSEPVTAAELGVYSHRLGDQWLIGGASNCGGALLAQHFSAEEIEDFTRQLDPDTPTGLDYYPLPARGERFPVNDPQLEPRLSPRPEQDARYFQAILEGLTRVEAQGYAVLESLGAPRPTRVLTTGGGAVNEPWRVMRERALGIPVLAAEHQDAAYGAALLALRSSA